MLSGLWEECLAKWVWNYLLERTEHSINCVGLGRVDSTVKPSTQSQDFSPHPPYGELKKWLAFRLSIDPTWRARNCSTMEGKINIIILILITVTWRHSMNDTNSTTSLGGSTNKSSLATSEKQVEKHKISNSVLTCLEWPDWLTKIKC